MGVQELCVLQKRRTFSTRIIWITLVLKYTYRDHKFWISGVYSNYKVSSIVFNCMCV